MYKNYLEWIIENGNPATERLLFGFLPAYPVFMFLGIILVIIVSIIKLKLKGIPLREFELAILIVVPAGVLGASIFGKAFLPGMVWYHIFFFWEPGMSLFGSLLIGVTAGFVWFYHRSKKTMISVWVYADCIIPNILLGQFLGRWGNFFNHEILGQPTTYESLNWLPSFIKDRLFYFPNLTGFNLPDDWWQQIQKDGEKASILDTIAKFGDFKGFTLEDVLKKDILIREELTVLDPEIYNYGKILYRTPLFLIEGIGNLILWFLLTFVVSNLGRWFSRPKPWDFVPKAYPGWYNKKYHSLPENEIIPIPTQIPIKYKTVTIKDLDGTHQELKLGFFQAWNKAYYWFVPDYKKTKSLLEKQANWEKVLAENLKKLQKIKQDYKYHVEKIKSDYHVKTRFLAKKDDQFQILQRAKTKELKLNKKKYFQKRQDTYQLIGNWTRFFKGKPYGLELEKIHNPFNYFVIRCGSLSGFYVVGYLVLRIILESQRSIHELVIPGFPILNFILLSLILTVGIGLVVIAQFIAPYRYREVDWLYEKSY